MYIYTSIEKVEVLDSMNFTISKNGKKLITTDKDDKGELDIIKLTEKELILKIKGKELYLKKSVQAQASK